MSQYLYTLPILSTTLLCMLFLTLSNEQILPAHKKGFFVAFLGEFFITGCELSSILLNNSAIAFKPIHFLSNYLGFLLTPILIVFFAASIGNFRHLKGALIGIVAYFVLCNGLVATKQLFFIDAQNVYHRGALFLVYIISYFISILYLLYETLRYSRKGFLHHKIFAYFLSFFFLLSCSIQIFNPEVYITRITVIISLYTYYTYNIELTTLFDKLTGVLNQGTYLRKAKELKEKQVVVILDIDNFKIINDNYGHHYGDECLSIVSHTIRTVFGNYGQCYRIGGDEFAVILRRYQNADNLIARFERAITDKFENKPCQLTISLGYSKFEKGDTFENVIQRADFNMYNVKKAKKETALHTN